MTRNMVLFGILILTLIAIIVIVIAYSDTSSGNDTGTSGDNSNPTTGTTTVPISTIGSELTPGTSNTIPATTIGHETTPPPPCPVCRNGAHCDDTQGKCICLQGFTGDDCSLVNAFDGARPPMVKIKTPDGFCDTVGQGAVATDESFNPYICKPESTNKCTPDLINKKYCWVYNAVMSGDTVSDGYNMQGDQNLLGHTCTVKGASGSHSDGTTTTNYTCTDQFCDSDIVKAGGFCWVSNCDNKCVHGTCQGDKCVCSDGFSGALCDSYNAYSNRLPALTDHNLKGRSCSTIGQGFIDLAAYNNPYICKAENADTCVADFAKKQYCLVYNGTYPTDSINPSYNIQGDQNLDGHTCTVEGAVGLRKTTLSGAIPIIDTWRCMKQVAPGCGQEVLDAGGFCWVHQT